jgi:hypothetical protein
LATIRIWVIRFPWKSPWGRVVSINRDVVGSRQEIGALLKPHLRSPPGRAKLKIRDGGSLEGTE